MSVREIHYLILVNVLANICYSIVIPFLPLELEKYGIDVRWNGFIFGSHAFAVILGSIEVPRMIGKYGRKGLLVSGMIVMSASMVGFGLIEVCSKASLVIALSITLRMMGGFSAGVVQTTSYSIVSIVYAEKRQKYLGILEASIGIGTIGGPSVGSLLYGLYGFSKTFYIVGFTLLICSLILYNFIPDSPLLDDEETAEFTVDLLNSTEENLTYSMRELEGPSYRDTLNSKSLVMITISGFFAYLLYTFQEPVLALRVEEFDLNEVSIGLFFMISAVSYSIACIFIPMFTQNIDNIISISIGCILTGLSLFLVGPSLWLPNSLTLMWIGQFLYVGLSVLFVIPALPEMVNQLQDKFPNHTNRVSDISSGTLNSAYGLGMMIGPVYGSYMTSVYGFRTCADTVAYMLILFGALYLMLCRGGIPKQKKFDYILTGETCIELQKY